jgi:hypothetical protein
LASVKRTEQDPLQQFVDELIEVGAVLSQIVAHMALSGTRGSGSPDAVPIPLVLGQVLAGVLEPVAERHGADAVGAAARLVGDARERIGDEIFLVPHDQTEPRS